MKKLIIALLAIFAISLSINAQNQVINNTETETDLIKNPTKEQLVGIWQMCSGANKEGRRYGIMLKIIEPDGKFKNVYLSNSSGKLSYQGAGTWEIKDECLVESVDADADTNTFAGKKNAMELRLSEGGNIMHLIYSNAVTGARVDEYFEKVSFR